MKIENRAKNQNSSSRLQSFHRIGPNSPPGGLSVQGESLPGAESQLQYYSGSHSYEVRFWSASILLAFFNSEQDARTPE